MIDRIWKYATKAHQRDGISRIHYFFDYGLNALRFGCSALDYDLYNFYDLNSNGKRSFITLGQRAKLDSSRNTEGMLKIIDDKEESLMYYASFMKRDWCGQKYHCSKDEYNEFCKKHKKAIIKNASGSCGIGVKIVSTSEEDLGKTFYDFCAERNVLAEELILQHESLNYLYPNAINTIRIVTFGGKILGAALRMGMHGAEVDNAHAGGIYAEIDLETGVVISTGQNYQKERFVRHPDTDTVIPGFQIPFWTESKELTIQATKITGPFGFIGWDIAVTPDGPTLVEANSGPGLELIQSPISHGLAGIN